MRGQAGRSGARNRSIWNRREQGRRRERCSVGLIVDAAGNPYGTTVEGGTYGYGMVFELTRSPHAAGGGWTEQVLHNFNNNGTDGYNPNAGLISDAAGNLYGTTAFGGRYGGGIAFEITH